MKKDLREKRRKENAMKRKGAIAGNGEKPGPWEEDLEQRNEGTEKRARGSGTQKEKREFLS